METGDTCVMLDCGFSVRETEIRLNRLDRSPADLAGILVTHEHSDHIRGVAAFARRHKLPVWMTPGTHAAARDRDFPKLHYVNCHAAFTIGSLEITPMPVPHDAREPCQYRFSDGARRLGVLTDTGHVTPHIVCSLGGCHTLAVECNHDLGLLQQGPYPLFLKTRVGGRLGHLNNDQAADLLERVDHCNLRHVVAVHLSEVNNTPDRVMTRLRAVGKLSGADITLADQQGGLDWCEV